jgi:hypothetical protein
MVGERRLEQVADPVPFTLIIVLARQGTAEGGCGVHPRKTRACPERLKVLHPPLGLVGVAAADAASIRSRAAIDIRTGSRIWRN